MTLEYVNYVLWPSNKMGIFVYYSYIQAEFENLGGVVLPTLCTRIHAHLRDIRKNIRSS